MRKQKRMPLLLIYILASMLFVNITAAVSAGGIYEEYNTDDFSQPVVAVLMQGLSHRVWPWESKTPAFDPDQEQTAQGTESAVPPLQPAEDADDFIVKIPPEEETSPSAGDPSESSSPLHPTADDSGQENAAPEDGSQNPAAPEGGNQDPSQPVRYEFTEVTREYFDDALFIGDSRAVGIQLYSGWDNLTYCTESGMTVYNMFDRQITRADGTKTTLEEALAESSFGKIYLEIGINEMGTGTVDSFMEAYENAVLRLRELQPDADIFLCGIMYVRKSKSDSDPVFNNPAIRERNERIAQLADQQTVFYLDINEVTSDENGNLNPDYTWDEIHLLGKYNVLWTEYLSSHGIVKETLPPQENHSAPTS